MQRFATSISGLLIICLLLFSNTQRGLAKESQQDGNTNNQTDEVSEIRKGLLRMNEMLATKDLQSVMSIYDDSDDIMVVGSDSGEVFIGKERVRVFMKMIVSMPFIFSFEIDKPVINQHQDIAWVFCDSKMVHTRTNGKVSKIPYRITAVLVKKGNEWKWKMFSGSIPRSE
jgi:ketosteroid isomerase-like protein